MAAASELKNRIPGWGADINYRKSPHGSGAHWDEPERQVPKVKILVSSEHKGLTPVFGSTCPPKGLSGRIREFAYRFSEGQKSHWALLLFADRVDVLESGLGRLFSGQAHNPLAEMGLKSEFRSGGFRTRFGQHRADVQRMKREALLILSAGTGVFLARRAMRRRAA